MIWTRQWLPMDPRFRTGNRFPTYRSHTPHLHTNIPRIHLRRLHMLAVQLFDLIIIHLLQLNAFSIKLCFLLGKFFLRFLVLLPLSVKEIEDGETEECYAGYGADYGSCYPGF